MRICLVFKEVNPTDEDEALCEDEEKNKALCEEKINKLFEDLFVLLHEEFTRAKLSTSAKSLTHTHEKDRWTAIENFTMSKYVELLQQEWPALWRSITIQLRLSERHEPGQKLTQEESYFCAMIMSQFLKIANL